MCAYRTTKNLLEMFVANWKYTLFMQVTLCKTSQNTDFVWAVLSHIKIESMILSLYGNIGFREIQFSGIFSAVGLFTMSNPS